MSNLWFFRLKRAEQQRRRSSGEQSTGSASVQSAAGISAASAPPTVFGSLGPWSPSGGGLSSQQHHHYYRHHRHRYHSRSYARNHHHRNISLAGGATSGGGRQNSIGLSKQYYRHSYDHASDFCELCQREEDEEGEDECEKSEATSTGPHFDCWLTTSVSGADVQQSQRASSLESGHRRCIAARRVSEQSLRFQRQRRLAHQADSFIIDAADGSGLSADGAADDRRRRRSSGTRNSMSLTSNQAAAAAAYAEPTSRPTVPQVNIIRSDSCTSSNFAIQMGPSEGGHEGRFCGKHEGSTAGAQVGGVEQRERDCSRGGAETSKRPVVVELSGQRVESRCVPGEQFPLVKVVDSRRQQQQQEEKSLSEQDATIQDPEGSYKFSKRGLLHDQLVSGKVPPISEHRLLNPAQGQAGAPGLSMADSMDNLAALIPRVRVEFYNSENTLKEQLQLYFIKDHTVSLYVRSAKLILKVLACYLYVFRVIYDRGPGQANCYGCQTGNRTASAFDSANTANTAANQLTTQSSLSKFDSHPYDGPINFRALLWVDRGPVIWSVQATIAVICLIEAILMQYLTYKNSIFSIMSFHFTLELITNVPFILSIFWTELRTLFVPGFLNCWLAKQCLEAMLNDLSIVRQSSVFSHRLTILSATVFCLIFTSACGFQHTQRSGGRDRISVFESIYFVVVTFSTVGYGDLKPETWPSQLFIMVMICVALIVLPTQFEQLAYFWIERKKLGASYAHHSNRHEKHVVVCSTTLRADTIMDFLNEFYAHPLLQTFSVVLLSPCEMDPSMKLKLQTPTWNNRVVYIQGSALKANDLIRARMQSAEACFILAARNYNDRSAADEHTILRSWAIRDFSPYVPQYVQIFRTENKIHVAFAEHVVCDDEFKYALLANNCLIPGTSTLVTLLLHTSQHKRRKRHGRLFRRFNLFKKSRPGAAPSPGGGGRPRDFCAGPGSGPGDCLSSPTTQASNIDSDDSDADNEANSPEWKRLYGKCSANEIYHIRLSDSRFFGEYQGKSFTYASFHSHRKFGVALIGVQTDMRGTWPIMLNPGPSYVLKSSDILFYINITKEENSTLRPMVHQSGLSSQAQLENLASSGFLVSPPAQGQPADPPASGAIGETGGGAPATYIRIEASSPTAMGPPPTGTLLTPASGPPLSGPYESGSRYAGLMPKKHSVADGASIVARSLCSVAGFAASEFPAAAAVSRAESEESGPNAKPLELQHLTTKMLAKRNSSASASGAIGTVGSRGGSGAGSHHKQSGGGLGSRNASTLELATLATGLRKGSNMSITSTKSRDASPTRLKQVVSGLAVKMKRVKLGKSLTHLTIPRMDLGGGGSNSSTESFVNARGRRPSIAPVPAMMGESEEHDSDHEREQESYFSMSWQSNSESSPIVKKFVFCTTYVGVSPTLCYLLQRKKPPCCLQLVNVCEHCPFKNARQYQWSNRCIILASDFASNGIYNFLVPLRAHSHNPNELRPIVLLLERKPSPQFIDAISWFPMVYWMPGSIDSLDDLIKAGINQAHSVVVTNKESTNSAEEDYLADCNTIVAVQTMFKMFPSAGIITELSQSSNMRFMQFRAHDVLFGGLSMARSYQMPASGSQHRTGSCSGQFRSLVESSAGGAAGDMGGPSAVEASNQQNTDTSTGSGGFGFGNAIRDRIMLRKFHSQHYSKLESSMDQGVNSHAYKYRLPFAAGNVFSASMLDTLLYQAFVKDYMITMVRLLLGIDQAPGSGFLSSMRITKEDLWIRTYGRLYQRLCSTTCEIPLGIYRTEPLESQHRQDGASFGAFASQQASYEQATEEIERGEIINMVKNRLQDLGMNVNDYDDSASSRNNTFSYVIINPNCDISLREGDIIYLIRPSPIHSRKLFMHRANSVRHADESAGAAVPSCGLPFKGPGQFSESKPHNYQQLARQSDRDHHQRGHHHHHHQPVGTVNPQADPSRCQPVTDSSRPGETPENYVDNAQATNAGHPELHLKSYYSDGDFNEILIKVNNHDDEDDEARNDADRYGAQASANKGYPFGFERGNGPSGAVNGSNERLGGLKNRRRSSCSDAEDGKRSS